MRGKRLLALLLAALLALSLLTACGEKPAPAGETESPASESAEPTTAPKPEESPNPTDEPADIEPEPPQAEEFFLEREEGCNQLTIYWNHPTADYASCDVWVWMPGKDGSGQPFYPCEYGVKCMVNVPQDVEEVGFIVRRDCSEPGGSSWGSATKDFEDDRFVTMTGPDTVIYLQPGDGMQYVSDDGGRTLTPLREFTLAGIVSATEIRYFISPAARLESLDQFHVRQGGREVEIESVSSLNNKVITGTITLKEELDVTQFYTVEIDGYGEAPAVPTALFDSPDFIENYTYDGDDLGAVIHGDSTTFKVWAPTASKVVLNLFEAGNDCEAYETLDMTRGEKGVWRASAPCGHGTYYTYTVTTAVGTQEAVDPYARAVGVNGQRGMVVDLAQTDPEGFRENEFDLGLQCYGDAVIWEVHVRDFSNIISASRYPGKYLAFTENGLTNSSGLPVGLDYLKELGITHVHLQPVYDYATVDESSTEPQFNWGYDPQNYNAPEGSYSTDPYHGEVRIREFKQMVQSLHENGMGVVMDVVYNHTFSLDSNLNRIVPYYYYRFGPDGAPSNGSGCGNETASDRVMFRKFMVDSVTFWAKEYQLDGFRFDLMALHDVDTMQQIEQAVHAVNPQAILYGEGWTGGNSRLSTSDQATQANIHKITASGIGAVAVFNDVIRDGLKGSVFNLREGGYCNGNTDDTHAKRVIFGIQGGLRSSAATWSVENAMLINYVSSHDNHTLWDKLLATCPEASREELLAMNRLCAATVMLSRGTPFFLAGEEMLRTKGGDGNSYASSDAVNNLDWEALTPESDQWQMAQFYRQLIAMRRTNSFFTQAEVAAELLENQVIAVTWTMDGRTVAYALINPGDTTLLAELPEGDWQLLLDMSSSLATGEAETIHEASVPPMSVLIVKLDD